MQEINPRIALLGSKHQECKTRDEQRLRPAHIVAATCVRDNDHAWFLWAARRVVMRLPDGGPMRVTGLVKSMKLTFARWLPEVVLGRRSQPGAAAVCDDRRLKLGNQPRTPF
jgi:hypothetical protein